MSTIPMTSNALQAAEASTARITTDQIDELLVHLLTRVDTTFAALHSEVQALSTTLSTSEPPNISTIEVLEFADIISQLSNNPLSSDKRCSVSPGDPRVGLHYVLRALAESLGRIHERIERVDGTKAVLFKVALETYDLLVGGMGVYRRELLLCQGSGMRRAARVEILMLDTEIALCALAEFCAESTVVGKRVELRDEEDENALNEGAALGGEEEDHALDGSKEEVDLTCNFCRFLRRQVDGEEPATESAVWEARSLLSEPCAICGALNRTVPLEEPSMAEREVVAVRMRVAPGPDDVEDAAFLAFLALIVTLCGNWIAGEESWSLWTAAVRQWIYLSPLFVVALLKPDVAMAFVTVPTWSTISLDFLVRGSRRLCNAAKKKVILAARLSHIRHLYASTRCLYSEIKTQTLVATASVRETLPWTQTDQFIRLSFLPLFLYVYVPLLVQYFCLGASFGTVLRELSFVVSASLFVFACVVKAYLEDGLAKGPEAAEEFRGKVWDLSRTLYTRLVTNVIGVTWEEACGDAGIDIRPEEGVFVLIVVAAGGGGGGGGGGIEIPSPSPLIEADVDDTGYEPHSEYDLDGSEGEMEGGSREIGGVSRFVDVEMKSTADDDPLDGDVDSDFSSTDDGDGDDSASSPISEDEATDESFKVLRDA